jgi:endonuclease/exonuclease/phosphatase (EEP) superfamily protein YafD
MVESNGPRITQHAVGGVNGAVRITALLLAQLYFIGLYGWLVLYLALGDASAWLFAVNSFAVYLFAPLPLAAVAAALARRPWGWALWVQCAAAGLVWAYFFGGLFVPQISTAEAAGPRLRVMTANLLGFNQDTEATLGAIRAADADVVALQELNPAVAAALEREMRAEYPYQVLNPEAGVRGSGVISRYPLLPTGETLDGPWLGTPHVLSVDFEGREVRLIRFHAFSGIGRVAEREAAARVLADYAATHSGPLLVAGDLNATGLSTAHDTITRELGDAWEAAGWGLGHTFPGADSPGSSRPSILGISVPKWLIRIDYVFYSEDFTPVSAEVGPWDGVSDHRPVLVEVVLED